MCTMYRPEDTTSGNRAVAVTWGLGTEQVPCKLLTIYNPKFAVVFEIGFLSIALAVPERRDLPNFASCVLGLKVCGAIPNLF